MGIQVTELTKYKQCFEKEFIDFEFNGKHISEFGMVAVMSGDRHSFDSSPTFTDETSSVNGVDGQYFWGTHFGSLKRTFDLATDGMTEQQINDFKLHFIPGKYGKFIEDKLAHRYGYARVSSVTTFNVIPFRKSKTITVNGTPRNIFINEYKGECSITFEFDNPFLYATENYINEINDENADEYLRAVYTNSAPLSSSWGKSIKCIIGDSEKALGATDQLLKNIISDTNQLIYYNPSNAKTSCRITMKFQPKFTSGWPTYFCEIADSINNIGNGIDYNTISITNSIDSNTSPQNSDYISHFYYSTPNVVSSINRTIQIAYNYYKTDPTGTVIELEETLRREIVNSKVMGWAASVLRIMQTRSAYYNRETGNFSNGFINVDCSMINKGSNLSLNWFQYFNVYMLLIMAECEDLTKYHLDNEDGVAGSWSFNPYTIIFDGIKSKTTMNYNYNQIIYAETLSKFTVLEETCGDMIYSSYLNLDGGDTLDDECMIKTCHHMKFIEGKANTQNVKYLTLEYQYTYL